MFGTVYGERHDHYDIFVKITGAINNGITKITIVCANDEMFDAVEYILSHIIYLIPHEDIDIINTLLMLIDENTCVIDTNYFFSILFQ